MRSKQRIAKLTANYLIYFSHKYLKDLLIKLTVGIYFFLKITIVALR